MTCTALSFDTLLQALYGWPPCTPLPWPRLQRSIDGACSANRCPCTESVGDDLALLLYVDLRAILKSTHPPSFLPSSKSIFIRLVRFEAIQMTHEVAQVSDGERRESCSICQDLAFRNESWTPFRMPRERHNIWEVDASYESLRLSSREGCPSCDLLYQFSNIVLEDIPAFRPELVTSTYKWWWEDSKLDIEMEHGDTASKRSFPMFVTTGQSMQKELYTPGINCETTGTSLAHTYRYLRNLMFPRNRFTLEINTHCTAHIQIPCFPRMCFDLEIMDVYLP